MLETTAQVISILAMIITIISVQFKKNQHFFICRAIAGLLFSLSFLLLGAYTGAISNLVNIIRSVFLLNQKTSKKPFMFVTIGLYLVAGLLTLDYSLSILTILSGIIFLAQVFETRGMWSNDGKRIRVYQACIVSPAWLLHNIVVFSIGGILTEMFTMLSSVIALFRFRKEN